MKFKNIIIIRRPLAVLCLIYIAVMYVYVMTAGIPKVPEEQYAKKHIILEGIVEDKYTKNDKLIVLIKKVKCSELSTRDVKDIGVICYLEELPFPEIGSLVVIEGDGGAFKTATNPGEFDTRQYYASKGYHFALYNARIVKKSTKYNKLREGLYLLAGSIGDIYNALFNDSDASVVRAMIIGDKNNLDQDVKDLFADSGIAHILSISGLHISIIGLGVVKLLTLIRVPGKGRTPITILIMLAYYIMTGMSPSTLRAVVMFSLMLIAGMIRRTYDLVTALALAAVYLVTVNPYILLYAGFWLSFMAVFGIAVFARCLYISDSQIMVPAFISKRQKVRIVNAVNSAISCMAVSFFTLPVLLFYYYEYPVYSMILNILLVPAMGFLLYLLVAIALLSACRLFFLARLLVYPCRLILLIYEGACQVVNKLPGGHAILGKPTAIKIVFFYFLCILMMGMYQLAKDIYSEGKGRGNLKGIIKKIIKNRNIINVLAVCLAVWVMLPSRPSLRLTMLDVGQGDGLILEHGNKVYVFDGGSSSNDKLTEYQLVPAIKSLGISSIDYWFVSHPDSDHYSGLLGILQDEDTCGLTINKIVVPEVPGINNDGKLLIESASQCEVAVNGISRGQVIKDGKLNIICLSPDADKDYGDDINSYSEVFLVCYDGVSILMTGDATVSSEEEYISYAYSQGIDIDGIDIYKVPHHGSDTSSGQELIDVIRPGLSLISCGINNRYGHPKQEVVDRLEQSGSSIYRTDISGAISLEIKGGKVYVRNYKKEQIKPSY
ncbi:MAG: DNA internalization-related competence protein ComEC/Rec2 [Lachnospiraceae bacterium]|nr:DNA internalization-related competence protein ComEC/Rec2 [Lachnospiraceae bacterium]